MDKAKWLLILHCHLPFIRHPEHVDFLEEHWLFEAMTGSYLPIIESFQNLTNKGIDFRVTVSLSPTLCEMLADSYLQKKCANYIEKRIKLCEEEMKRLKGTDFEPAIEFYRDRFVHQISMYGSRAGESVLSGFKGLKEAGRIDIITCPATHALLPLCNSPESVSAQVEQGCRNHEKHFGERPQGMWLPECAYSPEVIQPLTDSGIRYSFLESHGVLLAEPTPARGVFAPIRTPEGIIFFARDLESSKQVWSKDEGYPGDPAYRDFFRDVGFDAPYENIKTHLHSRGERHPLGLKYHRIMGEGEDKMPYNPQLAKQKAIEHARHFADSRKKQADIISQHLDGEKPIIVSPYDGELFGHWWLEGPWFLEEVIAEIESENSNIQTCTAMDHIADNKAIQQSVPSVSTWGYKGYYEIWVEGKNDWIYRHLAMAEEEMKRLAQKCQRDKNRERPARQCIRELMLAQSSDWPFLIGTDSSAEYAQKRLQSHIADFWRLAEEINNNSFDFSLLEELENTHNLFKDIRCDLYS